MNIMETKLYEYFMNISSEIPEDLRSQISAILKLCAIRSSEHISAVPRTTGISSSIDSKTSEEDKLRQIRLTLQRLQQEKQVRKERNEKEKIKFQQQIQGELDKEKQLQELLAQQKKEETQQRILKMQEKSASRREKAQSQKELLKHTPKYKPLYKIMEEEYKNTVELPELLKRKEELAKKRPSVRIQDLKFHSSQHSLRLKQLEKKHSLPAFPNYMKLIQIEQEKHMKQTENNKIKLELYNKKKEFANRVRHFYKPNVDPEKQKEMKDLIQKIKRNKGDYPQNLTKPNYLMPKSISTIEVRIKKYRKDRQRENLQTPKKRRKHYGIYDLSKIDTEGQIDEHIIRNLKAKIDKLTKST